MNNVTWSKRRPNQHDWTICQCEECDSYRKNEQAAIERQEARGEWIGNVTVFKVVEREEKIDENH